MLIISQAGLYLTNQVGLDSDYGDIISVVLLNTFLPTLIFFTSFSLHRTRLSLYLSKMSEAISQIEMKKILKMIPQALFFFDESKEEVMHESDAMMTFFG